MFDMFDRFLPNYPRAAFVARRNDFDQAFELFSGVFTTEGLSEINTMLLDWFLFTDGKAGILPGGRVVRIVREYVLWGGNEVVVDAVGMPFNGSGPSEFFGGKIVDSRDPESAILVVRDSKSNRAPFTAAARAVEELLELSTAIELRTTQHQTAVAIVGDPAAAPSIRAAFSEARTNKEMPVITATMMSTTGGAKQLNVDVDYINDKLREEKARVWAGYAERCGIDAAFDAKRERLVTDEANRIGSIAKNILDQKIAMRRKAEEKAPGIVAVNLQFLVGENQFDEKKPTSGLI